MGKTLFGDDDGGDGKAPTKAMLETWIAAERRAGLAPGTPRSYRRHAAAFKEFWTRAGGSSEVFEVAVRMFFAKGEMSIAIFTRDLLKTVVAAQREIRFQQGIDREKRLTEEKRRATAEAGTPLPEPAAKTVAALARKWRPPEPRKKSADGA